VQENPKIIYEVEAFLFQVKSCLYVLNQLIRTDVCIRLRNMWEDVGKPCNNKIVGAFFGPASL
jgi:hypothetical protein